MGRILRHRTRHGASPGIPQKIMKRILPALLALSLAANVQAVEFKDGVIYCKASVVETTDTILSVYLPPTSGYVDCQGNPATVWNIGNVPHGGVADTFFSDKGPGAFQVKNDGTCAAFVYVTTGNGDWYDDGQLYYDSLQSIFGVVSRLDPQPADIYRDGIPYREGYRLAVSTEVTGKVPDWRPLNWMRSVATLEFRAFASGENVKNYPDFGGNCYQYLSYLAPGETQLFDLKFWAPDYNIDHADEYALGFVVVLQASEFRAWPHDM